MNSDCETHQLTFPFLSLVQGLATGSVHHDRSLLDVFCGEERADHSVVAIKTHLRYPDNTFTPDKVLLVIRNPYHAIVANFNRVFSGQHTGTAPIKAWQKCEPMIQCITHMWAVMLAPYMID